MAKLMIEDVDVSGKRVLVRVDFNVPLANGHIVNDSRLRAAVPTILYLLKNDAKIILISHLGRPNGKQINSLSLKPCSKLLSNMIGKNVIFLDKCIGSEVENTVNNLKPGQIVLLENLRFQKQEIQNNKVFAKQLAQFADLYVNDAFGTIHRAHASIEGITHFIDCCAMGFLVNKELSYIENTLNNPSRSFVAVVGGSKISDKLATVVNLLPKVDKLILGGGMVYTFLKAKGLEIGKSLFELDKIPLATKLLEDYYDKIILPIDCLITDFLDFDTSWVIGNTKCVSINSIEPGWYGIDIGMKTILKFSNIIHYAKTVIWNGPLGIFEVKDASNGTFSIARSIANATQNGAITIVGGGDSALAIEQAGIINQISHISTGGGASLKFMGGSTLPGLAALTDRY